MAARVLMAFLIIASFSTISAGAQTSPTIARQISLGERIACQTSIEEVYWRHRTAAAEDASKLSFAEAVPQEAIRRNAEEAVLKSLTLQRFWGVTITGDQLQAELDRMAAHSKSPDVLRELLAAVGNDPLLAAECLARPLLTDRLLQGYYSRDERFHGETKARALSELAGLSTAASMRGSSGQYREMEWQRGGDPDHPARPGSAAISLQPGAFDERVKELRKSLVDSSGSLPIGKFSALREDDSDFYAVSILKQDNQSLRLATVQWQKVPFESWWQSIRSQLPMALNLPLFNYQLPNIANSNCRDDSWKPTLQLLDPRYWHTAVWTGTEMIIFGGMSDVGTEYNDGSRYNPATDTWAPIAKKGAPSVRTMHVAVWSGSEMVVFGGTGDATGGRYNPVTDTWRPTSTLGAPPGPFYASAVWTGKEMIVWGGMADNMTNTGARYNPKTDVWKAMTVPPLAARADHTAVWTGTEMVIWGGYDGGIGQMYNDGARYKPTTNAWTKISSTGAPNARYWHTAVWTGTEMIVWGGVNFPTYDLSGGRYNPATDTWTPTSLVNPPSLRWLHGAVWTGKEMVVQGGTPGNPVGGRYNPATDTWTATNPLNAANNGQGLTAVWTGKEMIVWGGLDDDFVFHYDGARYNPTTDNWLRTSTMNVPVARGLHSAVWTGSEMVVWGGFAGIFTNTGGRYDPATDSWKRTTTVGTPLGRENAAAVWTGTEAMFWGGDPDGFSQGTGGRYNPVTDSWKLITTTNAPIQRYGHTGVWTGKEMIIFGGMVIDDAGYRYNALTDTWRVTTTVNSPGGRYLHTAVWAGTEMIVWGGLIFGFNPGPTGGRYNPVTDTWTPTAVNGSPAQRAWPVTAWTGSEMIVWGGEDLNAGAAFNDGGRYNPSTNSWRRTNQLGAPSARVGQGVWTGTEMVLWGGDWDSSGGRYNPASDSWKKTTLVNAPQVRAGGRWSTVWTGAQMIVWGGVIETQQGNLYCASGQPNVAPVAANDNYTALSAKKLIVSPAGVLANDTDGNGDFLTAILVTKTTNGTLKLNSNGSFTYKAAAGFVGTDSFNYKANDGLARSNTATVTITVQ